jgi:hypothetical protein
MWRRLNREDLEGSNPLVASGQFLRFTWIVYGDYELVDQENEEERYFRVLQGAEVSHRYEPLIDTPHLFLEFARLYEAKDVKGAIREWIDRRGLLGLQKNETRHLQEHEYSDRGGPRESLTNVWEEARKANQLLALYEAALSGEAEKLKQAFGIESGLPAVLPFLEDELELIESEPTSEMGGDSHGLQENQEQTRTMAGSERFDYIGALIEGAMRIVIVEVQEVVAVLVRPCFGTLAPPIEGTPGQWWTPELLTRSWIPSNLLGAMYLQFYWLMTSTKDLSRCKHCNRIISYASAIPGSGGRNARKPRKDKKFCSSQCRQNYHYHHRIKPRRQGEST